MSYLSDEFGDANFYLVDADSKYNTARQSVTGKYYDLVRRNKRSEIQNMCLEYIFEELSEGEHVQIEGKIGHVEQELFIQANILDVGVLELKSITDNCKE
ncbi:hypothetical protein [Butyrivibrio proteoclasticus]|uniref:hypothetical protein n=1 Tax=Butyrivibrio proteoclasticus TaxID=43305 RepID=UPI00142F0F92|nr:hypothetical protein [Butyrivibrio proteoclasticus]